MPQYLETNSAKFDRFLITREFVGKFICVAQCRYRNCVSCENFSFVRLENVVEIIKPVWCLIKFSLLYFFYILVRLDDVVNCVLDCPELKACISLCACTTPTRYIDSLHA